PCNIASSEAHNRRTAEYMRNIGESRIYVVPELSTDNEQWINPDFGTPELRTHYDNIKQMVKEKTGRAMQEKERERKGKNGKIIKVAGCSPIREGVLLIRADTTLADVRKFGEECQRRWGITPLQIFLHKDEGHWLNGQPEAEDKESFQVGNRWFKPNYHAHVVFDWMNHETGKSRKLNDEDMAAMQTLASDILLMERGQAKAVTGKEHLERNDFIIEKQKAELQRIEETKRHKEQQVSLAEQELKQVKAEIRTDKLKSVATDAATAIASGVGSLFGSGKLKDLEQSNENLRHEIAKRDKGIDELKAKMQQMQEQHDKQIRNIQGIHNQELEAKDREISRLNAILEKAFNWFPLLKEMLRMEKLCYAIGFTKDMVNSLLMKKEAIRCNGKIYSEEHRRKFDIKNDIFKVEKNPTDNNKLVLTINRQPIGEWFREQWGKLKQGLYNSVQTEKRGRGFRM
ncbi:mobilization protein, partial [Bacteroides caecimuris]|uniref:mobilization protein n=1 Tax=Bacteroides caecimuris TaxID=1796613 RepID=UPI0026585360